MRKMLAAALLVAALAGCSDDHSSADPYPCPDGTVLDPETFPDHHDDGFDPADHCPVPPSVGLKGLPESMGAYQSAPFSWAIDLGDLPKGHSMYTSVVYATSPADTAAAGNDPDQVGKLVAKKEHQELPADDFAATFQPPAAGTYYLYAFARIESDNRLERSPFWSEATIVNVTPVAATGTSVTFTHSAGGPAGTLGPADTDLTLGDGLIIKNDDVIPHTFTITGPSHGGETVEVPQLTSSTAIVFLVPGSYTLASDEPQVPLSLAFDVVVPPLSA